MKMKFTLAGIFALAAVSASTTAVSSVALPLTFFTAFNALL